MHALIASLRLVCPPLSNQDADTIRVAIGDTAEAVRADLRQANIYMIGQREEIFFEDFVFDETSGELTFDLVMGHLRLPAGVRTPGIMHRLGDPEAPSMDVRHDRSHISVWDDYEDGRTKGIWAVNPDAFLAGLWRGDPDIAVAGDFRPFATWRLLYIGMSNDNAFQRLINAPHQARLDILTNEIQIRPQARVSDEIFFFLFTVDPLVVRSWGAEDEITDAHIEQVMSVDGGVPRERLISDIEKAFIAMLDTPYNTRKYRAYPKGSDGLSSLGLDSYAYAIAEDITFDVMGQRIDGGYREGLPNSNTADFILVRGEHVELVDVSEARLVTFEGRVATETDG